MLSYEAANPGTRPSMSNRRSDRMPSSRCEGRVKAAAAEGGGASAPALTRPLHARDHNFVRSRLTPKTVALPFRAEGLGEGGRTPKPQESSPARSSKTSLFQK